MISKQLHGIIDFLFVLGEGYSIFIICVFLRIPIILYIGDIFVYQTGIWKSTV